MSTRFLNISVLLLLVLFKVLQVDSCNEAVCRSKVSKCLLTQACRCELTECSCCRDCFQCLGNSFNECCSCLGMCPNATSPTNIERQSHVEDFKAGVPVLFKALTEFPDLNLRWTSFTYPVDMDNTFAPIFHQRLSILSNFTGLHQLNCTVAFIAQCTSWQKCRSSCQSMGAASYRWFYDGCCECVGDFCFYHGIDESRCIQCSSGFHGSGGNDALDLGSADFEDGFDDEIQDNSL